MKKMKKKMKFAVKMSHFLPNSVSKKNERLKNCKKFFFQISDGKERRMKKNERLKNCKKFFLRISNSFK
jgi:hypothetical protein